jgi:hypothetical protein
MKLTEASIDERSMRMEGKNNDKEPLRMVRSKFSSTRQINFKEKLEIFLGEHRDLQAPASSERPLAVDEWEMFGNWEGYVAHD